MTWMVALVAFLLAADLTLLDAGLRGTVLDAVTLRPLSGAVVTDGSRVAVTGEQGEFNLPLAHGTIEIAVQRSGYHAISERVLLAAGEARTIHVRLRPDALNGDPIEVTYEALKPEMLRQDKFDFPEWFQLLYAGRTFRGRYRVCIHADGRVSVVIPQLPAGAADQLVRDGIRTGWQYKPLPQPACFPWNVELRIRSSQRDNQLRRDLLPGTR